jgi:hypothetical protein
MPTSTQGGGLGWHVVPHVQTLRRKTRLQNYNTRRAGGWERKRDGGSASRVILPHFNVRNSFMSSFLHPSSSTHFFISPFLHFFISSFLHSFIHTCLHFSISPCLHFFISSFLHFFISSFRHSFLSPIPLSFYFIGFSPLPFISLSSLDFLH